MTIYHCGNMRHHAAATLEQDNIPKKQIEAVESWLPVLVSPINAFFFVLCLPQPCQIPGIFAALLPYGSTSPSQDLDPPRRGTPTCPNVRISSFLQLSIGG
ncbi:hypothetical protein CLAIMM_03403 isoform 1 [Cladophialophora immunda]|nr:hypothetical protein CLAIMM_03403 isoform 1 [Cladophialophora immunda]